MTPDTAQIIEAYDRLHMSIAEICANFGDDGIPLNETAVKIVLNNFSPKYQSELKAASKTPGPASDIEFDDHDKELAKRTIARIACSEDEYLALRASTYIRNDSKGRLDNGIGRGINLNIGQINLLMQQADKTIDRARGKVINLIPDKEKQLVENAG